MVRKTGFDPVASCTPSTRSAWLSYVLIKLAALRTRKTSKDATERFLPITLGQRLEMVFGEGFEPSSAGS